MYVYIRVSNVVYCIVGRIWVRCYREEGAVEIIWVLEGDSTRIMDRNYGFILFLRVMK